MPENLQLIKDTINVDLSSFSITSLVLNLVVGFIISLLIKIHYKKFSSTLNNRDDFANVFPFILLTIVLVISIVKSSLALSLGLVGALSIVRFRTPIKEPEELAYLFLCIAVGLGLGANQTIATIIAAIIILLVMTLMKNKKFSSEEKNMFLSLEYNLNSEIEKKNFIKEINEHIGKEVLKFDLRRLEYRENFVDITYQVNVDKIESLEKIIENLKSIHPNMSITYIDQNQVPSI